MKAGAPPQTPLGHAAPDAQLIDKKYKSAAVRLVLLGAGHAHLEVIRQFGARPEPGLRLTVITPNPRTLYTGMYPGVIASLYARSEASIPIAPLARLAGADLILDAAIGIDLEQRMVRLRRGGSVAFDCLSIDIGSSPGLSGLDGADRVIPVKPIDRFLDAFDALSARLLDRPRSRIVMAGGGAGGVELLLAVEQRARSSLRRHGRAEAVSFTLVTGRSGLLAGFPDAFRNRLAGEIERRSIDLVIGADVLDVRPGSIGIVHEDGRAERLDADDVLWAGRAAPASWLAETGLSLDGEGFILVDEWLRAVGRTDVFAAGDTIALRPRPIPRSGLYAVRAGAVLAVNLRRAVRGETLRRFRPQHSALYIITTGRRHAVAARNGVVLSGALVWHWKAWLDRRFVGRFASARPPGR